MTSAEIYFGGMEGLNHVQDFLNQPDTDPKDRSNPRHQNGPKKRDLKLLQTAFSTPGSTSFRYRDLRFEACKVTMVIGSKGCGKSSLLKALLGEVQLVSGNIIAPSGPISYSAESAFIQNMSIKDNIVGQSAFDAIWYHRVLHACDLYTGMERLPDADETIAGEGGSKIIECRHLVVCDYCPLPFRHDSLTPTQSLARAVYAHHPVLLLDETFDYLEPDTADLVLSRLFGKGGLLHKKCTVVFTSSNCKPTHRLMP